MYSATENISSLLISTRSVAFTNTDFHTTLCFVNQSNYKTPAMQALALTLTRYCLQFSFYTQDSDVGETHPVPGTVLYARVK
jgi:hypothetical protein